ncbi:MAG: hypothetical protein WCK27_26895 [Verrucomicrobiota bacterium]
MTSPNPNRPRRLRSIVRDVVVLVLAELLALGLAWCLSAQGRAVLARLFRTKRPADGGPHTTSITDV